MVQFSLINTFCWFNKHLITILPECIRWTSENGIRNTFYSKRQKCDGCKREEALSLLWNKTATEACLRQ